MFSAVCVESHIVVTLYASVSVFQFRAISLRPVRWVIYEVGLVTYVCMYVCIVLQIPLGETFYCCIKFGHTLILTTNCSGPHPQSAQRSNFQICRQQFFSPQCFKYLLRYNIASSISNVCGSIWPTHSGTRTGPLSRGRRRSSLYSTYLLYI